MKKLHIEEINPYVNIYKTRKKRLFIILMAVLVVFSLTSVFVSAATCNCDAVEGEHTKGETYPCMEGWNGLQKATYNFRAAVEGISVSHMSSLFSLDLNDGIGGVIWPGVQGIYNVVMPVGYALVLLYFYLDFIEKMTHDAFNLEQFFKMFIKLFIGLMFIQYQLKILEYVAGFANSLARDLPIGGGGSGSEGLYNQIADLKWYECIGLVLNSFVPYILSVISFVVVILTVLSRYLDVAVRAVFAPIGMANIYDGGINSSGMRYLKKYAAACLQGAVMCGILLCSDRISAALNVWATPSWLAWIVGTNANAPNLILTLCTAGALLKSKSIANDIMGV